ncbi:MAG: AgmX/PglI C-terminal domain-containing protein [Deltaproteobacteria bacterium]|nr:AgmX/PglI C-terminal domain-containing protein [Deltaproteobacteria bacterium]
MMIDTQDTARHGRARKDRMTPLARLTLHLSRTTLVAITALTVIGCASGGLSARDRRNLDNATKSAEPKFLACYEQTLAVAPDVRGKIVLGFDLKTNSTAVTNAHVTSSDVHAEGLEACVVKAASEMSVASIPDGPASITYPIEFSREGTTLGAAP